MSQSLLEKLQKKPVPEKKMVLKPKFGRKTTDLPDEVIEESTRDTERDSAEKPSEAKKEKGRVGIQGKIIVNTDANFDIQALRARIKKED